MKNERDFKGVWIDKRIWLDTNLTATEKCLLAEIDSLDNKDHCYAKNEYFAEFLGVSVPTVSRGVQKLLTLKYIEVVVFTGRGRILKSLIKLPNQNDQAAISKRSGSHIKMTRPSTNPTTSPIINKEYTPEFLTFWSKYPKTTNKTRSFKCWLKLTKEKIDPGLLTKCAENYAAQVKADKTAPNFIMHGSTFLGPDRRYEDYTGAPQTNDIPDKGWYTDLKTDKVYKDGKLDGHYDGGRYIERR